MAFTVTFPTAAAGCTAATLAGWLAEQTEPHSVESPELVVLRALPGRFLLPDGSVQAQLDITAHAPLSRIVELLFHVSAHLGADVHLAGVGVVNRATLWVRLADEQDRIRIAEALHHARQHHSRDEVHNRLWALVSALHAGRDCRWDAATARVVDMLEVGEGISLEHAQFLVEGAAPGDLVPVPVSEPVHILLWRWLSEAWPGLAEAEHTLH